MHSAALPAFTRPASLIPAQPTSGTTPCCLEKLHGVPLDKRTAHYTCYAALSDPDGNVRAESEGICRGRILSEPAGSGGFGYDPLFEVVECHRTFGELSPAVKRVLSHRSRAIRQLVPQLLALIAGGHWS